MKKPEMKFLRRTFAVLGLLLFWTGPLYAAFFFVGPTGSDSNPGTQQLPWRTIGRANRTLQPGDTVFIMNGEYSGERIAPANTGTAGNFITYSAFGGDTPVITAPPREPSFENRRIGIVLMNRDFIRIIGLTVDGKAPFLDSNIDTWALLQGADHNIIQDSVFRSARGYHGVYLQDSDFNEILDNRMDLVGDYDRNSGEVINLNCSDSNLVQGNTLSRGGHDVLVSNGNMNVLRENVLNNRWGPNQGYRAVTLTSNHRFCDRTIGFNLFERNTIMNALVTFDLRQSVAAKAEGRGQIVRNNVFTNNLDNAISSAIRPPEIQESRLGKVYNNTLFESGSLWRIQDFGSPGPADNNEFKNNAVVVGSETDNYVFISFDAANRTPLENNTFIANSFGQTAGNHRFLIRGIGTVSLDFLQANFGRFFRNNIEVLPQFVSVNPQSPDAFRLPPGSPLIDRGEVLTRTRSAGSGTSVPVVDAGYFSNGFGVVEGDLVEIDASAPVEVTNVNYQTNTLTLASRRSWSGGVLVGLPFQGSAPDIGAFEFGAVDNATCNDLTATIIGTAGDEAIAGTTGPDVIAGLGGVDQISGLAGVDTICGGNGNDTVESGSGNDNAFGNAGDDRISGNDGLDQLSGSAGADALFGNDDADALDGGSERDTCAGGAPRRGDSAVNCESVTGVP